MDRPHFCVRALVTAALVMTGCAGPQTGAPTQGEAPTPRAPEEELSTSTDPEKASVPAQEEEPTTSTPETVSPPPLLQRVLDADWNLAALGDMPPEEHTKADCNAQELIYDGGALRLYQERGKLYGLVVNHAQPAYKAFASLDSGEGYFVAHHASYTAVLRTVPLTPGERSELASRPWTPAELAARLGEPTVRSHQHGLGTYMVAYVPEGLVFEEDDTLRLTETTPEQVWEQWATDLAAGPANTDIYLRNGKASPDGRFQAAHVDGGGYWSQRILVREEGKGARCYPASYFIENYFWLDNRRLLYGEVQLLPNEPYAFHIVDVVAEQELEPLLVDDQVRKFGPAGEGRIWYIDAFDVRHEVVVP